jgi:hypothetical protein
LQPIVEDLKKVKHFLPFVKGFLDLEFLAAIGILIFLGRCFLVFLENG